MADMDDIWGNTAPKPGVYGGEAEPSTTTSSKIFQAVASAVIIIVVTTRFFTAITSVTGRTTKVDGKTFRTGERIPYWLPYFGHVFQLISNADSLLGRMRTSTAKVLKLVVLGRSVNIISDPAIATDVLEKDAAAKKEGGDRSDSSLDDVSAHSRVRSQTFGMSSPLPSAGQTVDEAWAELTEELRKAHRLMEPGCDEYKQIIDTVIDRAQQDVTSFVSFNDREIDQHRWERSMRIEVTGPQGDIPKMKSKVELFELVRNFVFTSLFEALFGTSLPSEFESFFRDLLVLEDSFPHLTAGFSRGLSSPKVTRGLLARRKLLNWMRLYHQLLDSTLADELAPEASDWPGLSNVSPVVTAIHNVFFTGKAKVEEDAVEVDKSSQRVYYGSPNESAKAAASESLFLLWSLYSKLSTVVYWQYVKINSDSDLLNEIRNELGLTGTITVTNRKPFMRFYQHPVANLNLERLTNGCPKFRRAYNETLDEVCRGWVLRKATKDLVLSPSASGPEGCPVSGIAVSKGEWLAIPAFSPGEQETEKGGCPFSKFGTGNGRCKAANLSEVVTMVYTGLLLSLWDLFPVPPHRSEPVRERKETVTAPNRSKRQLSSVVVRPEVAPVHSLVSHLSFAAQDVSQAGIEAPDPIRLMSTSVIVGMRDLYEAHRRGEKGILGIETAPPLVDAARR